MLSILYYIWLTLYCAVMLVISVVALAVTYPFQKSRRIVHELSRWLAQSFLLVFPRRIEGLEHVDRKGRYVIVLNHQSMVDIVALYFVPLNFRWVSKREVFRIPFIGQFLLVHGDIPIDRGHAAEAMEQMLREGKLWLSRGVSVSVFPEGTRSRDGEIHRFKAGAFTLAIMSSKVNGFGTTIAHFLGTPKIQMANILRNPKLFVPVVVPAWLVQSSTLQVQLTLLASVQQD